MKTPLEESAAPPLSGALRFEGGVVIRDAQAWWADGAVVVENGKVLAIGPREDIAAASPQAQAIDASKYLIAPGLINAHTHVAMSFFRGLGHAQPRADAESSMIESLIFPAEKSLTPQLVEDLSYSYALGALRSGTTCVGDHYYFSGSVARALEALGMRGMLGECAADLGATFPSPDVWKKERERIEKWPFSSRIRPVVAPHAADTVSKRLLTEMAAYAKDSGLPLHMHLAQTEGERTRVKEREGSSPVAVADACGALGENSLLVHLVAVDDEDLKRLAASGATAGFCPASQIIYQQLAPIKSFLEHKIPIAVSTDAACSNDSADLLSEVKLASLLCRHEGAPRASCTPSAMFDAVTRNPARTFGLADQLGTLKPGAAADAVFYARDVEIEPLRDPITDFIFSVGASQVRHVLIDGRWALWQRRSPLVNEDDVRERFITAAQTISKVFPDLESAT
jgi:5-methylthioadenosine/S-adenosylhomocysteine deaminase